jgi:hypothetical protein
MTNEHLREFLRIVDEWIRFYRSVGIAGLPGTERRAQLEKIMWSEPSLRCYTSKTPPMSRTLSRKSKNR